jgi:hypothetical protein
MRAHGARIAADVWTLGLQLNCSRFIHGLASWGICVDPVEVPFKETKS